MALAEMGFGLNGIGLNGYWPNWELDQVALDEMALDEMGLDEVAIDSYMGMQCTDKDQGCISLSSSPSIDYWLVHNVCESDTRAGQP